MKRLPRASILLAAFIAGALPCGLLADVSSLDRPGRLHAAAIIGVLLPPSAAVIAPPGGRQSWISDAGKQKPAYALAGDLCLSVEAPSRRRTIDVDLRHRWQPRETRRIRDRSPPRSGTRFDQ